MGEGNAEMANLAAPLVALAVAIADLWLWCGRGAIALNTEKLGSRFYSPLSMPPNHENLPIPRPPFS